MGIVAAAFGAAYLWHWKRRCWDAPPGPRSRWAPVAAVGLAYATLFLGAALAATAVSIAVFTTQRPLVETVMTAIGNPVDALAHFTRTLPPTALGLGAAALHAALTPPTARVAHDVSAMTCVLAATMVAGRP